MRSFCGSQLIGRTFSLGRVWVTVAATFFAGCGGHFVNPQPGMNVIGASQTRAATPKQSHVLYDVVDLGSGSVDTGEGGANGHPLLSRNGVFAGALPDSTPTGPHGNPSICDIVGPESFVLQTFNWYRGIVTTLGALGGAADCSVPFAESSDGSIIIGSSENGSFDPQVGFNQTRAVRWVNGHIADLGSFGGNQNGANDVNTRGDIIGGSENITSDPYSILDVFLYGSANGTQTRGFVWRNGKLIDLGTLGGNDALALFNSDGGLVTGSSYTDTTPNQQTGVPTLDPFLWKNGHMQDLGTLGGVLGIPSGVNNRGDVIGRSDLAGDQTSDPFLWKGGRMTDLATSTKGGTPQDARAITDGEEIIGGAVFSPSSYDAYLWRHGRATNLGHPNGDCFSEAMGVNSREQVVGGGFDCSFNNTNAFIWEDGRLANLNDLISPRFALHIIFADGITPCGMIMGVGTSPSGEGHAVLLIPKDGCNAKSSGNLPESSATAAQPKPTQGEVEEMRARMRHLYWRPFDPAAKLKVRDSTL